MNQACSIPLKLKIDKFITASNLNKTSNALPNYRAILKYNCWSCNRKLSENEAKSFFCPCPEKKIYHPDYTKNYFELFDIKPDYEIDKKDLARKFRNLMRKLHPDLFAQRGEVIF